MRILYFSKDYTTHDRHFLLELANSRHEVWFLRLEDRGIKNEKRPLPTEIHRVSWKGGHQIANTPESWLHLVPDFESILNRICPDLIHAGPVQSCGFIAALADFHPLLIMSWGSDILVDANRDEMWRWITCYTLKHSDILLCDCQAVRLKVEDLVHYEYENIVEFPWGVNLHQFTPGADVLGLKNRAGWDDAFLILSTRSWEPIYGVDVLLDAFKRAYSENHRLRLVLLGDGSLASEIQRFIVDHGLDDVIYRPGMISHEQTPNYFRATDLYLSCSYSDGTSVSLLEAMATGMPVVVTDGLGNREWVKQGDNGWLVPAGDVKAFTRALLLAADMKPAEIEKLSNSNRKIAEERANWDENIDLLLKTYDRLEVQYAR